MAARDPSTGGIAAYLHLPSSELPYDVGGDENLDILAEFEIEEDGEDDLAGGRMLGRKSRRRVTGRSRFTCLPTSKRQFGRMLTGRSRRALSEDAEALGDHGKSLGHFSFAMNEQGDEVEAGVLVYDGAEDLDAEAEWSDEDIESTICTTDGGYVKKESKCAFPFKFRGKTFNECASFGAFTPFVDDNVPADTPEAASRQKWCPTVKTYSTTSSASKKKVGILRVHKCDKRWQKAAWVPAKERWRKVKGQAIRGARARKTR